MAALELHAQPAQPLRGDGWQLIPHLVGVSVEGRVSWCERSAAMGGSSSLTASSSASSRGELLVAASPASINEASPDLRAG